MSNTRVSQGHKVAIAAGGQVPARVSQGDKIILLNVGTTPSLVSQAAKVILFKPSNEPEPSIGRRRGFMSFSP
jgi:hypothetical protein